MKHNAMRLAACVVCALAGCIQMHDFGVQSDSTRSAELAAREKPVTTAQYEPIFGLAGHSDRARMTKTWYGPVVEEKDEVTDTQRNWAPWPLALFEQRGGTRSAAILPVYWGHDDGGHGQEYIFPLWWRQRLGMERTTSIFPLYKQVDYLEEDVGGRVRVAKSKSWFWPFFNRTTEHKLVPVREEED